MYIDVSKLKINKQMFELSGGMVAVDNSTHSSMTRNTLVLSSKTSRRATILGCFSLKREREPGG